MVDRDVAPPSLRRVDTAATDMRAQVAKRLSSSRPAMLFIALPTLLAAFYFFVLAANRYEAEASFVVRTPGSGLAGQLSGMLQGSSITRSADDAYIVEAYITSRDAVRALSKDVDLRAMLDRAGYDVLWRYPGLFKSHNEERLTKYMNSLVDMSFNSATGVSTLKVQAFAPDDAKQIAEVLLKNAERLINRLSERGQENAIANATRDVDLSRATALAAQRSVTDFRIKNSTLDPSKISKSAQETIARLALERAQSSAQLSELTRSSPQSPQIESVRGRIAALDEQIQKEREALAGSSGSLAEVLAEYERLSLERELAERAFASSLASLEVTKADSRRQRLFLENVSEPAAPDYAAYPYRLLSTLIACLVCAGLFVLLRRLIDNTREHDEP